MFFAPFTILGMWLRGLLGLAIIAGGVALAATWYRSLPAEHVVREDGPNGPLEVSVRFAPLERITAWRPGLDLPTACLAGGALLLVVAFAGRFLTGPFLGRRGGEPLRRPAGEVRRVRRPDGTELHVEMYGPAGAQAVVLTHGWGIDGDVWAHLIRDLGNRYRLITWDLPGLGRSSRAADNDYSVDRLARDLRAVAAEAGSPVVLAGHSIGGMATLTFCRLFPDALGRDVTGLVLTNTTYTNPVRTTRWAGLYTALQRPVIEPLLHLTVWLSPVAWALNALSYFNGSAHRSTRRQSFAGTQTRAEVERTARYTLTESPAVLARGGLGMLRYDASDVLGTIPVPTMVVAGDRDPVTVPAAGERIAEAVPKAEFVTLAPARHQGFVERRAEFARAVDQFLIWLAEQSVPGRPAQPTRAAAERRGRDVVRHGEAPTG
jgi:pimeloyl-ACP methyl ester carboxylesterase